METAFIIIPLLPVDDETEKTAEITALTQSAGAEVKHCYPIKIHTIVPATYIGSGKLNEIKELCEQLNCNLVIFDGDLSPSQLLNIKDRIGDVKVIDRTTLILDIFATRATSAEGKIQVELAQLKYIYPRLKGKGAALSRLGGGIGTRGPGESKLESDRRHIRQKINHLEERLLQLKKRRDLQSERRNKNQVLQIALVGYTNTGKSTLINALTGSDVYAEDRLFATLDPTRKKLDLGQFKVLISDTVGFIKNIPTTLIEAFKSTLETAVEADLICIVCDAKTDWENQLDITNKMLDELKTTAPRLIVFNKCEEIREFELFPKKAVFISALEKKGLDNLLTQIRSHFDDYYEKLIFTFKYSDINKVNKLFCFAESFNLEYFDNDVKATIIVKKIYAHKFKQYL